MKVTEIKKLVCDAYEYEFLRTDPRFGSNLALLSLGGSYAYGTNTDTSDIDIRGVAVWTPREILLGRGFDTVTKSDTDTVIYSFDKFVRMLADLNPSVVEIFGCKPEHYLHISPIGQLLLDNKDLFLSKRCINSFGGFAFQQANQLRNCVGRMQDQTAHEQRMAEALTRASANLTGSYQFSTRPSTKEGMDSETYITASVEMPVRNFLAASNELGAVVRGFDKDGKRVSYAVEKSRLAKMMMHCVRAYHMAFDLLENGEVVTYREKDHDELMAIRNGYYLGEDGFPVAEFFEMIAGLESKLRAYKNTSVLPDGPDMEKIEDLIVEGHRMVLDGGVNEKIYF